MITYHTFAERCDALLEKVAKACTACGRAPDSVKVLAVTKTHPAEAAEYAVRYGLYGAGENRVQEAIPKIESSPDAIRWELIGHLQSNKAKLAAQHFDRIQSVDSEKLLKKLNTAADSLGKQLPILLEVNAGDDPAKFGVSCEDTPRLLEAALECSSLRVEGLMTIAPLSSDKSISKISFERLSALRDTLEGTFSVELPELSMGMTGDFEAAIQAGSTLIRVGTYLYGERPPI